MPNLVPEEPIQDELLLLAELNHRIANEFSCLISIVGRTAAACSSDEAKRELSGLAELLHQHADVHRALRVSLDESRIDAADYLDKLCRSITRAKLDRMNISLVLAAHSFPLDSSRCWRLGMIVSELITNAARHAFSDRPGVIRVELFDTGGFVKCAVTDNGSAPAQIRRGRGLMIIEELTRGLEGWFERKFGPAGSSSVVIFPYPGATEESPIEENFETLYQQASRLYQAGRCAEATEITERLLALAERKYGPKDEKVAAALNALAGLYYAQERGELL